MANQKFFIICAIVLALTCTIKGFKNDPRNEFYNHAVAYPTLYHPSLIRANYGEGINNEEIKLEFEAFNKRFVLDLKENKNLLSPNYREILLDENFEEVIYDPINESERRCYYQGHLANSEGTWAAISICNGISGVISTGSETYYIEPTDISGTAEHLVFKASDRKNENLKCGVANDFVSVQDLLDDLNIESLNGPYNDNKDPRYIEAVVVNDHSLFEKYNESEDTVFSRTKQVINVANSILSRLNTFLTLKNTLVWKQKNLINVSPYADDTLDNFLSYRRNSLVKDYPNDNGIFITNQKYLGGVLGNAYRGYICTDEKSGENLWDFSSLASEVGFVVAHELGHNLGAPHDDSRCQCEDRHCVMVPYFGSDITKWSSCSKSAIQKTYSSGKDSCLLNKPTQTE